MTDTQRTQLWNRRLGVILGAVVLVGLLATAGDYGLTYDEPVYASRAMKAGQWLRLLASHPGEAVSPKAIEYFWNPAGDEQAGLMKSIGSVATMLTYHVLPPLAALRAGTCLLVALLVGCMFVFVSGIWGRAEGLVASLGLVLMPQVFAHSHLMAMDAPVMAFSFLAVMAVFTYARTCRPDQKVSWEWLIAVGLAFGAAIASKLNGFFMPVIVLIWLLLYRRRALWLVAPALLLGGVIVFVGSWPWLWHETAAHLARYLAFFGKHYPVAVTYFGRQYQYAPWHFAPVMLLLTTPPLVLGLALWGSLFGCRKPPARADEPVDWATDPLRLRRAAVALMLLTVLINLLPSCLPGTPKYNGVRLFMPVFPPLAVLMAVGFGALVRPWLERQKWGLRQRRLVTALLVLAVIGPLLSLTVQCHPWGMSYYSLLIGGPKGAMQQGLEVTYWGETYRAALPWLNEKAPPNALVWINVPGFVSSMRIYQSFGLLRQDLRLTAGGEGFRQADVCLVGNKPTEYGEEGRWLLAHEKPLLAPELLGAPLVWVFAGPKAAAP